MLNFKRRTGNEREWEFFRKEPGYVGMNGNSKTLPLLFHLLSRLNLGKNDRRGTARGENEPEAVEGRKINQPREKQEEKRNQIHKRRG